MVGLQENGLERELLEFIIMTCAVEDPPPPELVSLDAPLIGPDSPLGLDSLDAVEIVVAIERRYGARIGSEQTSRMVFQSTKILAKYVREHMPPVTPRVQVLS